MSVAIAHLAHRAAPVHSCEHLDWADVARLVTDHVEGPKDGPAWMPTDIGPGPRRADLVRGISCLVIDVEARTETMQGSDLKRVCGPLPPTLEAAAATLQTWSVSAALATSHSHEAPAFDTGTLGPRYRVAIELSRPVAPEELRALGRYVAQGLGIADCFDAQCLEPARLYYLPRYPAERAHLADRAVTAGGALDVDAAMPLCGATAEPPREHTAQEGAEWLALPEAERERASSDIDSALKCISADSYEVWIKVGHALSGLGPQGQAKWENWSKTSPKFQQGDEVRFDGFKGSRTSYRAIFTLAQSRGWVNPAAGRTFDAVATFGTVAAPLPPGALPVAPPTPLFTPLPLLPVVPVGDLATAPPEPQVWWVAHYLPAGHVALLGGHGGAGKSTLALVLAVCVAMGLPFMGLPTRKGRVLFFSAEDPGSLVRRRLAHICRILGIDPAELAKCLHVVDLTDGEPGLFAEQRVNGARVGTVTPTYQALVQFIEQHAIDVVIVDNASDVYEGDEINRASVRAFIRSLALLVRPRGGAVLLLAHVDKATSRAGKAASSESYSGSTAWHNSVRSRLFFLETGPGLYELQHQKSNLGPRLEPLTIMWPRDGLPQRIENPHAAGAADDDMRALLALIAEFTGRGEYLSTSPQGRPSLTQALSGERSYPRHLKPTEVFTVLRDAERRGLLAREPFTKDRKPRERFAISDAGRLFVHSAPSAPSARHV